MANSSIKDLPNEATTFDGAVDWLVIDIVGDNETKRIHPDTLSAGSGLAVKVSLNSAAVQTLNGTPVQLIAAPGAGKGIDVISIARRLNFGGAAASAVYEFIHIDTVISHLSNYQFKIRGLDGLDTRISKGYIDPTEIDSNASLIENKALMVMSDSDNPGFNGTVDYYILYRIVTL